LLCNLQVNFLYSRLIVAFDERCELTLCGDELLWGTRKMIGLLMNNSKDLFTFAIYNMSDVIIARKAEPEILSQRIEFKEMIH
jgi:hypothetical protein